MWLEKLMLNMKHMRYSMESCKQFLVWFPKTNIFQQGMMEGIASMHSWIKAQTMIR